MSARRATVRGLSDPLGGLKLVSRWPQRPGSAGSGVVRSARRIETATPIIYGIAGEQVRGLSDPLGGLKQRSDRSGSSPATRGSGVVRSARRIETIISIYLSVQSIRSGVVRSARRIETQTAIELAQHRRGSGVVRSARRIETHSSTISSGVATWFGGCQIRSAD